MTTVAPDIIAAAEGAERHWHVPPPSVSIGQYGLESAWGKDEPIGSNNGFGIKAKPGEPFVLSRTREEHADGSSYYIVAEFEKFATVAEAFDAHAEILATAPIYASARALLPDLEAFVREMAKHYATAHNYADELLNLIRVDGLERFDVAPATGIAAPPPADLLRTPVQAPPPVAAPIQPVVVPPPPAPTPAPAVSVPRPTAQPYDMERFLPTPAEMLVGAGTALVGVLAAAIVWLLAFFHRPKPKAIRRWNYTPTTPTIPEKETEMSKPSIIAQIWTGAVNLWDKIEADIDADATKVRAALPSSAVPDFDAAVSNVKQGASNALGATNAVVTGGEPGLVAALETALDGALSVATNGLTMPLNPLVNAGLTDIANLATSAISAWLLKQQANLAPAVATPPAVTGS